MQQMQIPKLSPHPAYAGGKEHVGTLRMEREVALHACLEVSWFNLFEDSVLARVASLRLHMHGPKTSLTLPVLLPRAVCSCH